MTEPNQSQAECSALNSKYGDEPELSEQNTASGIYNPSRTPKIMHHEGKNPSWKVCPFNLEGQCRRGYNCWYSHDFRNVGTDADWNLLTQSSYRCSRHRISNPDIPSILHGNNSKDDACSSSQACAENFKSASHVEYSSSIEKRATGSRNLSSSNSKSCYNTSTAKAAIAVDSSQTCEEISTCSSSLDAIASRRSTKDSAQTDLCNIANSSTNIPSSSSSSQTRAENSEIVFLNTAEQMPSQFDSRIRAEAPEFVPQSWMNMAPESNLCPNFVFYGKCSFSSEACPYVHGERCDMCQLWCLGSGRQRRLHLEACQIELEADMEEAFAVQRSQNKKCGICHDVVWDKEPPSEQRFGILERCNHVFCLSCIRTWRRIRRNNDPHVQMSTSHTRQCPECRVHSDFFVPSSIWVEDVEKLLLLQEYKISASMKPCRYYSVSGTCPLGDACFYLHTFLDEPPTQSEQQGGELDPAETMLLWNFLETKEE